MRILTTMLMVCSTIALFSQTTIIEGYIYESGNRGYLSNVSITAENMETEEIVDKTKSNEDGSFKVNVPINSKIRIYAAKDMFDIKRIETEVGTGKAFLKLEMGRAPGYTFEVTLAEKRTSPDTKVDAITGTRIEVYNNTTRQSVMDLKDHDNPEFQLNLQKGNHYTILIRKNGFLSKRMEAKVDVEGCILCFEGVGKVDPGVSDNLTEGNSFGVLLANVELERIFEGKTMEIQNLYYDLGKWGLTGSARNELNKVITLMKDNPNLTLELGSHTDSRGTSESNLSLSKKRAKSAGDFLINNGGIAKSRLISRGYGEDVLINNCTNGAKCTEKEHSVNRRTELKIIGITDMKNVKSLAQMKKEEYLEQEMLGFMDQEQVQAKDEEELKRIIEEDKKVAKELKDQINGKEEEVKSNIEVIDFEESKTKEDIKEVNKKAIKLERPQDIQVVKDTEAMGQVDNVIKEVKETKETKIKEEVLEKKKPEAQKDSQVFKDKKTSEEIKAAISEADKKAKTLKEKEPDLSEFVRVEENVKTSEQIEKAITGADHTSTDGIKVILFQSKELLKKDHFIFLRHPNVEIFDNGDGRMFYMTEGGFKNESQAFKFFNTFIRPDKKYEGSFVASIEEGVLAVLNQ